MVWYICWLFAVYDSPSVHPRISEAEKTYIKESLGGVIHPNAEVCVRGLLVAPCHCKELLALWSVGVCICLRTPHPKNVFSKLFQNFLF